MPNQGARAWYTKKRFLIPIAFFTFFAVVGIAVGAGDKQPSNKPVAASGPTTEPTTKPTSEPTSAAPTARATTTATPRATHSAPAIVKVRAEQILNDYADNELAADDKYEGKRIQVTGVVDKIDTSLFNKSKYILRIRGDSEYEIVTVNCNGMSKRALSTLSKGKSVTALGDFDDGGDLGVELNNCVLR